MSRHPYSILIWIFLFEHVIGKCTFPTFLWRRRGDTNDDSQRTWVTETEYLNGGNSDIWDKQKLIRVGSSEMTVQMKTLSTCNAKRCYKEEAYRRRTCYEIIDGERYKVIQGDPGQEKYGCLKFVQRSEHIVQVWTGAFQTDADVDVCDKRKLVRQDWPWTSTKLESWSPSPILGGYDFESFMNGRKRRLCSKVWRPSRLEIECILGDGLQFLFPDKSCSPFFEKKQEFHLQSWGNWTEGIHEFIVLSEPEKIPQFVMRLPYEHQGLLEYTSHFYLGPIAPMTAIATIPGSVKHFRMEMSKSESGVCYDDDPIKCEQFAKDGECGNRGMHQVANHCKRSCNLCNLAPSESAECHLPLPYQGEWLLFENDRRETVSIRGGHVILSKTGSFICKGKHWENNQYKMISVFSNGCRPRYSCMEFLFQDDGHILRFRLSKSTRLFPTFEMCSFEDDGSPLKSMFRSADFKTLLPATRTVMDNCGLGGLVYVNAMFTKAGTSCIATLSDWDPFSCTRLSRMTLSFKDCRDGNQLAQLEHQCEAYLNMRDDYRLMITKELSSEQYNYVCWIIKLNRERAALQPWSNAFILPRAQCGAPEDLDPVIYKPAAITFQIYSKNLEDDCLDVVKDSTPDDSTIHYTLRKGENAKHNKTNRIFTTPARTAAINDKSSQNYLNTCPKLLCNNFFLVVFLAHFVTIHFFSSCSIL